MVIFTIILVVGFFCIAIAAGYVVIESNATEGEKLLVGSLSIIGCLLIVACLIQYDTLYEDASIISEHTDHDKTRVIKENGKTKELYVTIDGEEYHFVFEENKK